MITNYQHNYVHSLFKTRRFNIARIVQVIKIRLEISTRKKRNRK